MEITADFPLFMPFLSSATFHFGTIIPVFNGLRLMEAVLSPCPAEFTGGLLAAE